MTHRAVGPLCLLFLTVALALPLAQGHAAGGGSPGGGGSDSSSKGSDPERVALRYYRAGLRARDSAWRLEEKAAAARDDSDDKAAQNFETKAQKQFEKAVTSQNKAISSSPDMYQAHASLGYALRRLGRYDEALVAYDRALEIQPRYGEAVEYRGEAYLQLGRLEDAKRAFEHLDDVPELAAQLLESMEKWVEQRKVDPGNLPPAKVESFAKWVQKQSAGPAGEPTAALDSRRW